MSTPGTIRPSWDPRKHSAVGGYRRSSQDVDVGTHSGRMVVLLSALVFAIALAVILFSRYVW